MSTPLREYRGMGATLAVVGLSAACVVVPPAYCVGGWVQQNTLAAGTLWLGTGLSQIPGLSGGMMWLNTTQNPIEFWGPNQFFLYASGATVVCGIGFKYSAGLSSPVMGS